MKSKNRPKLKLSDYKHYLTDLLNDIKDRDDLNLERIKKAFYFAGEAHAEQYRQSGEPYIMHPVAVARIVVAQGLGEESIIAALLHDTVEDTDVSLEQVIDIFGNDIATIVDSLSHFDETLQANDNKDVKTLRKILFSMSKDFRTVYIKIADRLHNMSTLEHMPVDKQIKKATETAKIYIGLAKNLNLWQWKTQLEDYCMKYLEPKKYKALKNRVNHAEEKNHEKLEKLEQNIKKLLSNDEKVSIHKYSLNEISNNLIRENSFIDINNLYYVLIQTNNKYKCYEIVARVHEKYKAFITRFKDYISIPKENGYQALHTTIFTDIGLINIKIKDKNTFQNSQKYNQEEWVKKIALREKNIKDDKSFHNSIVGEVLSDTIRVYSSFGEEINIPQNSTVLDFLLYLYKEKTLFVRNTYIEDKQVGLDYILTHGDIVEVEYTSEQRPVRLGWFDMLNSYESKSILIGLLGGNENYDYLLKGYEEFKYWISVFDIENLKYIYKNYEKNLSKKFDLFEDALISLGKKNINIKEFLALLLPLELFNKIPRTDTYIFALDISNTIEDKIDIIMDLMFKHLQEGLPSKFKENFYVSLYGSGIKVKYFLQDLNNLIDFMNSIKKDISQDMKIKYIL
ncbi:MAG: GTP pyrophosphokinase (EC, (p)ppGpp synthetase II / Guanosine-3',5'-bis(diphosphate) 3'-pyrophosphohydrolase (EC [uncultured Campylobacterales bacterium]|uniref:GTP pyrophosphokinase (EC, (P)ppGpp synthetase II / Guanosine-3',5'-bis(Diphosphate) 3'-pyrophosphohydrolase (EC)) n=1 Tax=uncultured Campylobacterales bacterium TaxID=352960 RepID=A0A6S6RXT4_9BACT|nr:MAG: GTP pyrophosphokinase (EC, (p)ppGpp synthetase II / Guanosine-3',5'-bis(diphosphate) 3'-pyrophosphohydrolase (EC [uncultured Campylobacterales bacterium]